MFKAPQIIECDLVLNAIILLGLDPANVKINTYVDIFDLIQQRLPTRCIESFIESSKLTSEEISDVFQIDNYSLACLQHQSQLEPQLSFQLWLIAIVFAKATKTFGAEPTVLEWLRKPQRGLNMAMPLDLLANPVGAFGLMRFLDQIDYGVYV